MHYQILLHFQSHYQRHVVVTCEVVRFQNRIDRETGPRAKIYLYQVSDQSLVNFFHEVYPPLHVSWKGGIDFVCPRGYQKYFCSPPGHQRLRHDIACPSLAVMGYP